MVDFEWYRSFIAVYRSGTVTGAAKARFLTQPAISQHIAALESSVGHSLFERTPRKMLPTDQGKSLYSRLAPTMDGLEKVSASLKESTLTTTPTLKLGVPFDYFYEIGIDKLQPSLFKLHIEFGETDRLIDKLSHGKLHAVIASQQISKTDIDYNRIDQEDFCLVSAIDFTFPAKLKNAQKPSAELEQFLLKQKWISYSAELPIIRRFWNITFNQRPKIEPHMIAPNLTLIRKAVESDWGLSILPRYLCQHSLEEGKLKVLWEPKNKIKNDLWIATRKVDRNQTITHKLISLLTS